jgi:hypothetical protein
VQIAEKNLEKDTGIPKTQKKATKSEHKRFRKYLQCF